MERNNDEVFEKLIQAYLDGKLSPADTERLRELVEASSRYQERYTNMVKSYVGASIPRFEAGKQANYESLTKRMGFGEYRHSTSRFTSRRWHMVAAALVGFFFAAGYFYLAGLQKKDEYSNMFSTISVPIGGKSKIVLPDETVVWLNAGSSLKYRPDFNGQTREVYLDGEGFFDVSKDEEHPFWVHTQHVDVKVFGTEFNVKAYDDDRDVEVNLITGKVNVAISNGDDVPLLPNEQLIYQKAGKKWKKAETIASRSAWWTSGKLYIDNQSLTDIMKTLERRFDVTIQVQSKHMESEYFSGSIAPELNVMEILQYLDVDRKYMRKVQGHTIVISDK